MDYDVKIKEQLKYAEKFYIAYIKAMGNAEFLQKEQKELLEQQENNKKKDK